MASASLITRMVRWIQANKDRLPVISGESLLRPDGSAFRTGKLQVGATAFPIPNGAWHNTGIGGAAGGSRNATGFPIFMLLRVGVAADPDENGHIYLEIAPDNNGALPVNGWVTVSYIAFRNNQAANTGLPIANAGGGGSLGAGTGLASFVPEGWWWRLRPAGITSYNNPEWIADGANAGCFFTFA